MMKNLTTKMMMLGGLLLLILASCKKDGQVVSVDTSTATASLLTASSTTPVLTKATLTTTAVTFTATAPKYGYDAAYTNTLQIAVKGKNFAGAKEVPYDVNTTTKAFNVQDFNNILLGLNLSTGVSGQVEVRVKSSLSTSGGIIYSNTVTITTTPFALVSYVYLPGSYQSAVTSQQWIPATADSLQSPTGNGIYTGIINFPAGRNQFLITPVKTWDNKYATGAGPDTAGKTSSSYAVTYNGSNNFFAPNKAGAYRVTLNTNANTLTIVPVDYYSLIGDAGIDWNTDVDLKYNNGTLVWSVTTALKASGAFKIRKNHDWGTSWGWPKGSTYVSNLASSNSDNITVATNGNYLVTFTNIAADFSTATYSAVKQ